MSTRKIITAFAVSLLLTGCGYRAPLHKSYIPEVTDSSRFAGVRSDYMELAALMSKDTGLDPTGGNTVGFIPEGRQKLDLLLSDLRGARESIYMDIFRFLPDSSGTMVMDILTQKAAAGADVRLILDRGAHFCRHIKALETMRGSGVKLTFFRKPVFLTDYVTHVASTHRDHRKITVTDGLTCYLGGRNIKDPNFFEWKDADIRVTGPLTAQVETVYNENQARVARDLQPLEPKPDSVLRVAARMDTVPCLRQFYDKTIQVVPESPTDRKLPIRNCFEWSMDHARRYFWLYNPYTPPPPSILRALKNAAARGVDVRWILPGHNDVAPEIWMGESLYGELLKAGVHIYEWQGIMTHAKQFMVDDYLTAVGSANMDNLSLFMMYEVEALVYDEEFTRHAADVFLLDIQRSCKEVTLEDVRRWSIFRKLRNWLTRALAGYVS